MDTVKEIKKASRARADYIATSGIRKKFFENRNFIFDNMRGVYLSRLKADDGENQKAFRTNTELLRLNDLPYLDRYLRNRITVLTTCFKNGGIDNAEEMFDFFKKFKKDTGINKVIFNNLQKDVSNPAFFDKNNLDNEEFEKAKKLFMENHFWKDREIVYSGGYTIETFIDGDNMAGFKRYHENEAETKKLWKQADKRSYDYSVSPNGDCFVGLKNSQKINVDKAFEPKPFYAWESKETFY